MNEQGVVFNIQRFSVHDGPGIRTVVFLKGCPLACVWCCNPESQRRDPEIFVDQDKCTGCGECVAVCPQGAIRRNERGDIIFKREMCTGCGLCCQTCLPGARTLAGRLMSVREVLEEVRKDEPFYRRSEGGLTVSGGEPLAQADFCLLLLQKSKESGLNTAIETSGFVEPEKLAAIAPYVDLFLYDLKHLDANKHRKATGVDNRLILANLDRLRTMDKKTALRIPVIPGFNDTTEDILRIVQKGISLGIDDVYLLPYHEYGCSKYRFLGREYKFIRLPNSSDAQQTAERIKEELSDLGITVRIGG